MSSPERVLFFPGAARYGPRTRGLLRYWVCRVLALYATIRPTPGAPEEGRPRATPWNLTAGAPVRTKSVEEAVRDYLVRELTNHPDDLRGAVLARAEALMREVQA